MTISATTRTRETRSRSGRASALADRRLEAYPTRSRTRFRDLVSIPGVRRVRRGLDSRRASASDEFAPSGCRGAVGFADRDPDLAPDGRTCADTDPIVLDTPVSRESGQRRTPHAVPSPGAR